MSTRQRPEDRVTAEIIQQLENGVTPWRCPWDRSGASSVALRSNGVPYRGINRVLLMLRAAVSGYSGQRWITYNQAKALKAQVRKGETSTYVVYYGSAADKRGADEAAGEEASQYRFLKGYPVFNVDQVDGLPDEYYASPEAGVVREPLERLADIERFIEGTEASITWMGAEAVYYPGPDMIRLPNLDRFTDIEQAYATACHELVHWTGAKHRLDRDFSGSFGSSAYAREELVAEIGAAFLGQHLGFRPDHITEHASYIDHWLKILRSDSRAIITAASKAQAATDYLLQLAGRSTAQTDEAQDDALPKAA